MNSIIQFALLGLGLGTVYTMLGQGITLVYRASGILNFAHGALAMVGAFTFYEMRQVHAIPVLWSSLGAMAVPGAIGGLFYWLVLRNMRSASTVARVIATLGLLTLLQGIAAVRYEDSIFSVEQIFPTRQLTLLGFSVPADRLILLMIACGVTVLLHVMMTKTMAGLATSAVSENERAASALGWSPERIALASWVLGAVLAGAAAILIAPLTGLVVTRMTLLVIPALAAALLAGFRSFPLLLASGLLIGMSQSVASAYIHVTGVPQSLPFLVIVMVLVVRGKSLPTKSHVRERMPTVGTGSVNPFVAGAIVAIGAVLVAIVPGNWADALTVTFTVSVMLLSIVVVTGYAGQLSLAQYALGGVGALVAARLEASAGASFELAILGGVIAAAAAGVAFGLPALRARGTTLAIVTLGLGYALQEIVFKNADYSGGAGGTTVGPQTFFGIKIDGLMAPRSYAYFSLGCLAVCMILVTNMRRGRVGRRLLATRTNERAAASLGVSVLEAKVYAFGISAGMAGLAGILLVFKSYFVVMTPFDPLSSINAVTLAVVGGVGFVFGPVLGATLAPGAVPGGPISAHWQGIDQWLPIVGGAVVIIMLMADPNGMFSSNAQMIKKLLRRRDGAKVRTPVATDTAKAITKVSPRTLQLRNVSVRYGGVEALKDVSFDVSPGEVVGLIGPNGAGKTTLIDAVCGFVQLADGSVVFDGKDLKRIAPHRRARRGLTRSFQSLELFDDISVQENIEVASETRDLRAYVTDLIWPRKQSLPPSAVAAIDEFGLRSVLTERPQDLPYADRRLVAIARATATAPSVLLLDEPAAGLSESSTAELAELVRTLAKSWGIGVLLVEHDMSLVMNVCDRVVVLEFGKQIASGTPAEVSADTKVVSAYLGAEFATVPPDGENVESAQ